MKDCSKEELKNDKQAVESTKNNDDSINKELNDIINRINNNINSNSEKEKLPLLEEVINNYIIRF